MALIHRIRYSKIQLRSTHIYTKGCGLFGSLGLGDALKDKEKFTRLVGVSSNILKVSAGWGHSAFVTKDGELVIFGILTSGSADMLSVPTLVTNGEFIDVKCSAALTATLTQSGDVYCFGKNRWGQCGTGDEDQHIFEPKLVNIGVECCSIDTGLQHCVALSRSGDVYCWGKGERGQLGNGSVENCRKPRKVNFDEDDKTVVQISAGMNHNAAITATGSIYVWGKHMSIKPKQTAAVVKSYEDQYVPRKLHIPGGRKAIAVCCSNFTTVIKADDNTLWAVGLGEIDRNTVAEPIPVQAPLADDQLDAVDGSANAETEEPQAFALPTDVRMKKCYNRVIVITSYNLEAMASTGDSINTDSDMLYEVILHNNECYMRKKDELLFENYQKESNNDKLRIIDYEEGWLHSIVLCE